MLVRGRESDEILINQTHHAACKVIKLAPRSFSPKDEVISLCAMTVLHLAHDLDKSPGPCLPKILFDVISRDELLQFAKAVHAWKMESRTWKELDEKIWDIDQNWF